MPLESNPQTIADLDANSPVGSDPTTHTAPNFNNIKHVLQNIFPGGDGGPGYDAPVLATVEQLNYLQGADSNIQDQLDTLAGGGEAGAWFLSAPAGTILTWLNPVAPAGWSISPSAQSTAASYSLVVGPPEVAGQSSGRDSPLSWSHGHAVQSFSLSADQIPPHTHQLVSRIGGDRPSWDDQKSPVYFVDSPVTGTDLNAGHTRTSGGGAAITQAITAAIEFQPLVVHTTLIVRDDQEDA